MEQNNSLEKKILEQIQKSNKEMLNLVITVIILAVIVMVSANYYIIKSFSESYSLIGSGGQNVSVSKADIETIVNKIEEIKSVGLNVNESITGSNIQKILDKIEEVEAVKFGGVENFEVVKEIYLSDKMKNEQLNQFNSMKSQLGLDSGGNSGGDTGDTGGSGGEQGLEALFESGVIGSGDINSILTDVYVKGDENAKILWLEYSDLECPFCKKLHDAGTLDSIMEEYAGQIKYVFQHFPLDFHQKAIPAGIAVECVGDIKGGDGFYEFLKKAFSSSDISIENLASIGEEMGVNSDDLRACIEEGKFESKLRNDMSDGSSIFGVSGTPGNVIINTETGNRILISGAYPTSNFEEVVEYLLDK